MGSRGPAGLPLPIQVLPFVVRGWHARNRSGNYESPLEPRSASAIISFIASGRRVAASENPNMLSEILGRVVEFVTRISPRIAASVFLFCVVTLLLPARVIAWLDLASVMRTYRTALSLALLIRP